MQQSNDKVRCSPTRCQEECESSGHAQAKVRLWLIAIVLKWTPPSSTSYVTLPASNITTISHMDTASNSWTIHYLLLYRPSKYEKSEQTPPSQSEYYKIVATQAYTHEEIWNWIHLLGYSIQNQVTVFKIRWQQCPLSETWTPLQY